MDFFGIPTPMPEVRFKVDDRYLSTLNEALGNRTTTDIMRDALTILNWAVEERRAGRMVLSAKPDGTDVNKLVMPSLEYAAATAKVTEPG